MIGRVTPAAGVPLSQADAAAGGDGFTDGPIADNLPPIVANGNCANINVAEAGYLDPIDPQSARLNIELPERDSDV
jgi:hypothetical protein